MDTEESTTLNIKKQEIEDILNLNKVKDGWKHYILHTTHTYHMTSIIEKLQDDKSSYSPKMESVFNAFSYFEPKDTKVIIMGPDPVPGIATGLSFSMNCLESSIKPSGLKYKREGHSVWKLHQALKKCGLLEKNKDYPCDHKQWAEKGVLLLNAALTVGEKPGTHLELWKPFTIRLLKEMIADQMKSKSNDLVFVLLFGVKAKELWFEATAEHSKEDLKNFQRMESYHPAYSEKTGRFLDQTTRHFTEINLEYPEIFSLRSLTDDSDAN